MSRLIILMLVVASIVGCRTAEKKLVVSTETMVYDHAPYTGNTVKGKVEYTITFSN